MATLCSRLRFVAGAFALVLVVALGSVAGAQQPTSVNPTASAVNEQQLLRQLNQVQGRCSIPDEKACVVIQPEGRDWRRFHQITLRWLGAISILGMLVALVVFYLWRGMVRIESGRSGRTIVRFNAFERLIHWMTASCFIILALSGLNITFGRTLLLPLMGAEAFTAWSQNLGHSSVLTTLGSYGTVAPHRQAELIRAAGAKRPTAVDPDAVILARALLAKVA